MRRCTDTHYAREKRTRFVSQEPLYGGAGCGPSEEVRETKRDPIACAYSAWGAWRNVSNPYEQKERVRRGRAWVDQKTGRWVVKQEATRSIAAQPKYGGAACDNDSLKITREVVQGPIHCATTQWGPWQSRGADAVSRSCRGLRHLRRCTDTYYELSKRNRYITRHPAYGGNGCPHLVEYKDVERPKIHCSISWGSWQNNGDAKKKCTGYRRRRTCNTKQPQVRYGTITRHPAYGGNACGSTTETREINV